MLLSSLSFLILSLSAVHSECARATKAAQAAAAKVGMKITGIEVSFAGTNNQPACHSDTCSDHTDPFGEAIQYEAVRLHADVLKYAEHAKRIVKRPPHAARDYELVVVNKLMPMPAFRLVLKQSVLDQMYFDSVNALSKANSQLRRLKELRKRVSSERADLQRHLNNFVEQSEMVFNEARRHHERVFGWSPSL